ncbi:MAG: PIN domain-containing protein [Candidatus Hydrogenedentes bacterium]|nr:PIN domain-containing protein [Candidatus Hydrogenedentota bacterium]
MILLDTNVLIYASGPDSPFYQWARATIADAVAGAGAALNAVSLAELCVGDADPPAVADRVRRWGIGILDVPTAAAEACAEAYRQFRERRWRDSGRTAPSTPLPDFFIGAHAMIMGWELATTDQGRFTTYFPSVTLKIPL